MFDTNDFALSPGNLMEHPNGTAARGSICILVVEPHGKNDDGPESNGYSITTLVDHLVSQDWQVEAKNIQETLEIEQGERYDHPSHLSRQLDSILRLIDCDYFIVLHPGQTITTGWIDDALARLDAHEADLVICSREKTGLLHRIGMFGLEWLTGCLAANSDVIVARKAVISDRLPTVRPAGRWLSLELQLRVPKERSTLGLMHNGTTTAVRPEQLRFNQTELSFVKSFIDHRFGNVSRLVQFCAVGFSGMFIDLSCYASLQAAFRRTSLAGMQTPLIGGTIDLALAGFLAVWLAMTWNFLLNRRLTFNDARRNSSIVRQYLTYATGNALAIGVSLIVRLWLPTKVAFFNDHKLAAALVGIVLATGISFTMARYFVFKPPATK